MHEDSLMVWKEKADYWKFVDYVRKMLRDSRHSLHTKSTNSIRKALDPMTASKSLAGYTQWNNEVYILTKVIQMLFN